MPLSEPRLPEGRPHGELLLGTPPKVLSALKQTRGGAELVLTETFCFANVIQIATEKELAMNDIFSLPFLMSDGTETTLAPYKGKYLLIVNVASKCGYTKQYEGLEQLQKKFGSSGFTVLGFPCNQFGGQEPGSDEEIQRFCSLTFGTTFPVFAKVSVNGAKTHPLYAHLKSQAKGLLNTEAIKWNFTKFLVDPSGEVLERFAPATTPEEIGNHLQALFKI